MKEQDTNKIIDLLEDFKNTDEHRIIQENTLAISELIEGIKFHDFSKKDILTILERQLNALDTTKKTYKEYITEIKKMGK